jgi:hypothetical protein
MQRGGKREGRRAPLYADNRGKISRCGAAEISKPGATKKKAARSLFGTGGLFFYLSLNLSNLLQRGER